MVKRACLEFNVSKIPYQNNQFNQGELLNLNQRLLMNIQSNLARNGAYDKYYKKKSHKGLYIKPLIEIAHAH